MNTHEHDRFRLRVVDTPCLTAVARTLMREYASMPHTRGRWLTADADIAALPQPYVPPHGVLLVAFEEDSVDEPSADNALAVGALGTLATPCIGELKRIYVRPRARRRGLGEAITLALIDWAGSFGFERVRLDTAPELTAACALYERLGFARIAPYKDGLLPDAVCYERAVDM